jgi:hypothetical protein
MTREDNRLARRKEHKKMTHDTVTIKRTPAQRASFSSVFGDYESSVRDSSWAIIRHEVVSYGSPSDAGLGGRLAVRENAEALRRLRDA